MPEGRNSGRAVANVVVVVVNPRQIQFRTYNDLAGHLNTWAAQRLVSREAWADAIVASRQWLDYSGRNQVLLASYGVDGPVAGTETWRLVPSTTEGRPCAVRAGEHGWPVRVPVTAAGSEPDPYLGGTRPTRSAVERFEWRPVFAVDQLARRPAPGVLTPIELPASLAGAHGEEVWLESTRKVARSTVRGRLPQTSDPQRILSDAAARIARRSKSPELDETLREQIAWLVADRVGLAPGTMPPYDPEPLQPRDRWPMLQDVLDSTRKLTATLGVVVGLDLTASPLPRMEIVDDRVVPAGTRRRLPAASFEQLPVGAWVTVGPYTAEEWAARGEHGGGRGAYLRLNKSAYLVAVENGDAAAWRLEDIAERTGHGLLARGEAGSLHEAKADAVTAVEERYPALGPSRPGMSDTTKDGSTNELPTRPADGWRLLAGEGKTAAQERRLSDQVVVYAFPGPGGRWLPAIQDGTSLKHLPYARTVEEARNAAERVGTRAVLLAKLDSPAELDRIVADISTSSDYSRSDLVALVGTRLMPVDRERLGNTALTPCDLVELLGSAGITPATTVQVLRAEAVEATEMAALLPVIGVPMDDAIRVLNDRWEMPRTEAAELLGATAIEMRSAGCTPAEILATRPRDVLRSLPADPHTWELAAGTMAVAGHPTGRIVSHLVEHAPTPDAFASGLATVAVDPSDGFAAAVRYGAQGELLAAASEHYGLSPEQTATLLVDAGAAPQVAVETIYLRADRHSGVTAELAESSLSMTMEQVKRCIGLIDDNPAQVIALQPSSADSTPDVGNWPHPGSNAADDLSSLGASGFDPADAASLLQVLPQPGPATSLDPADLLELLPDPLAIDINAPDVGATP